MTRRWRIRPGRDAGIIEALADAGLRVQQIARRLGLRPSQVRRIWRREKIVSDKGRGGKP